MDHINGVLFIGGALNYIDEVTYEWKPYAHTVNTIFEKAKSLNDNGVHFPIWGICMGHQLLMFLTSRNIELFSRTNSYGSINKLQFRFKEKSESKLFSDFSNESLYFSQIQNVTTNFNNWELLTEDFLSDKLPFSKFYKLLVTSIDRG